MKPMGNAEETIKKKLNFTAGARMRDRIWRDVLEARDESEKTEPPSAWPNIWKMVLATKVSRLAAAAVVVIAVVIVANMFSGSDDQPAGRLAKDYKAPIEKAFDEEMRKRERDMDEQAGAELATAKLDMQLQDIEQMFKANDVGGLVAMLSEGEFESKVAAANYLAKMGAVEALKPLENLRAEYLDDGPDNPFDRAAEEIKRRVEKIAVEGSAGVEAEDTGILVASKGLSDAAAMNKRTRVWTADAQRNGSTLSELSGAFVESRPRAKEVADGYPTMGGGNSIAEVVPEGLHKYLVLYYSFNSNESPDTAVDISGRGFHGQVCGAKYATDEVLGGAMSFDGEDDYIGIPNVYLDAFTVAAWVKTPRGGSINNRRIFMLYDDEHCYAVEGNSRGGISASAEKREVEETTTEMTPRRARPEISTEDGARTTGEKVTGLSSYGDWPESNWADSAQFSEYDWRLKSGAWTHITVTYDGVTGGIYRNGRLTETGQIPAEGFMGTAYIGGIDLHNGGFWDGMLDEVALFSRALTEEEVAQLYLMTGEMVEATEVVEESGVVAVDGRPELVAESDTGNVKDELLEVDSVTSTKHTVATGFTGYIVYPADVDGDGDLDVIGAAEHGRRPVSRRPRVRSSAMDSPSDVVGTGATHTSARVDIDTTGESEDDNNEGQGGIVWWQNADGKGTAWTEHIVDDSSGGAINAYPADIDRDGDMDIVGSDRDAEDVAWWENTNGGGTVWIRHPVDQDCDSMHLVNGVDIDNDGDIDVVGAAWLDGGITWWENSSGNGATWEKHIIDGTMDEDYCRTHSMWVADIDGDRNLDVVASAGRESGINWWKNPKNDDTAWTRHYVVGSDGEVESVYPADLDNDGDADIVGSIRRRDGLTWWENTNGAGTEWTKHVIDSSYHSEQYVDAVDMDNDGDPDILGSAQRINAMMWWENANGKGTAWIKHIVSKDFGGAYRAYGADMDGDGDLDMLGVAEGAEEVAWFER